MLVRVGADLTDGGGRWNGPMNSASRRFAYVAIPESKPNKTGHETPYGLIAPCLAEFGCSLPEHLSPLRMHLDPDYRFLTYGDRGSKGQQISKALKENDLLVFYSGLRDVAASTLVYAIVGFFVIERIVRATDIAPECDGQNAHTHRVLADDADDIVVFGKRGLSGRLTRCVPIGDYRSKAYRVFEPLLTEWGGLSVNDGYLQRSAVFPRLLDAKRFLKWWQTQGAELVAENNPV